MIYTIAFVIGFIVGNSQCRNLIKSWWRYLTDD